MNKPHRTPVARLVRALLALAALVVLLILLALLVSLNLDWNRAKPWLNARTSEALGRPFVIAGDLSLTWEKQPASARNRGWRARIAWPHLLAHDIHIGNPAGLASAPEPSQIMANQIIANQEMASIRQIAFSLNPFALLDKTIAIPLLRFDAPVLNLRRDAAGKNNWTFRHDDKPAAWKLQLEQVVLSKGQVHLTDAIKHADLSADIDTIDTSDAIDAADAALANPASQSASQSATQAATQSATQSAAKSAAKSAPNQVAYGVSWKLHGSLNREAVTGEGKAGAVLSLQQQTTPYPIMATLRMGKTRLAVEGTLTRPTDLAALDMRLSVSGASMARLYALTGVLLPETPPFATQGHLIGSMYAQGGHWIYEKFSGKVGSSDIGGTLDYQSRPVRGLLSGTVLSHALYFDDLAPLIGADSNASKIERGAGALQPGNKVLPLETFKTERWTSVDADIHFKAEKIIRKKALPINKLSTHLALQDGVLTLTPLAFDIAGGSLKADITLDGSGKISKNAVKATIKVTARHLKLKQLFPTLGALQASVGEINGDASLSAVGNSVGSLLGAANGEIKTLIDQGTVSKLLLEQMGLNIGNVVLTSVFGDKQVKLNCMATDFGVSNGLMQTRTFIIDTDEAVLDVSGTISLSQEQLDLTIHPDSKGLRVFSLRAPIYVRGSFAQPRVSVDKGVLALRVGGALALGAVAPFAALIPLVNAGPGERSECARLLADARVKPVAPAPGKTYRAKAKARPHALPHAKAHGVTIIE